MTTNLDAALSIAMSGMQARQGALSVVSDNIANVKTEGYSRKLVAFNAKTAGTVFQGVELAQVTRAANENLTRILDGEVGQVENLKALDEYYRRLEDLMGRPNSASGLDALLSGFNEALQQYEVDPNQVANKQSVLDSAQRFTQEMRFLTTSLQQLRSQADDEIFETTAAMNEDLEVVNQTNYKIQTAVNSPTNNNGIPNLQDQRDQAIRRLNEAFGVRVIPQSNDTSALYLPTGQVLSNGRDAVTVSFQPTPDLRPGHVYQFGGTSPPFGLMLDDGARQIDVTNLLQGGKVRGLLDMRDTIIPALQTRLDELAEGIIDRVNRAHNDGASTAPQARLEGRFELIDELGLANTTDPSTVQLPFASGNFEVALTNTSNGEIEQLVQIDLDRLQRARAQQFTLPNNILTVGDIVNAVNGNPLSDLAISYSNPATPNLNVTASLTTAGELIFETVEPGRGVIINSNPVGSPEALLRSEDQVPAVTLTTTTLASEAPNNSTGTGVFAPQNQIIEFEGPATAGGNITIGGVNVAVANGDTAAVIAAKAAVALNAALPANVVGGGVTVNGDRITVEFDTAANAATALTTTTLGGVTMTVGVVQNESIIGFEVVDKNDGNAVSNIEINLATLEGRVGAGNVNLEHITDILNGGLDSPGNLVAISSQHPPDLGGVPGAFGGPGLAGVEASITNGRFQIRGHSNNYQVQVREDPVSGTQIFPSSALFSAFDPPVPNVAATSVIGVASTVSNITSSGTALTATTIINPTGFVAGEVLRLQVNDRTTNTTVSNIEIDLKALQDAGGGVNGVTLETLIETINGYSPTAAGGASIISSQFPAAVIGTPAGRSGGPGLFGAKAVLENGQMQLIGASDRYDFVVDANAVAPKNPDLILTANNPTTPPKISPLSPRNGNVGYFFGLNDFLVSETEDSPQSSTAELINVRSDLNGNVPALSHGAIVARNVGSNPTATFTIDAGDGSAVNAMVDAVSGAIQIGDDTFRSAISFAGDTVSNLALASITNNNAFQYKTDLVESTRTLLAAEVEVNMDEELNDLIVFQRAYNASARVVTAVKEMFDVVTNMVG